MAFANNDLWMRRTGIAALMGALSLLAGCSLMVTELDPASRTAGGDAEQRSSPRRFDHVVIIVLENQDFLTAMDDPYLAWLATRGTLFTNFRGLFHNSYPNYLAMVGGRAFAVNPWI